MLLLHVLLSLNMQASAALPWVYPGDIRDRLKMSDVVVSGFITNTSSVAVESVDGTELDAQTAHLHVDRTFKGKVASAADLSFTWFRLHPKDGKGFAYAGPPLSNFEEGKRYLIFLKSEGDHWVVSLPLYAIEVELGSTPPPYASPDVSGAAPFQRDSAIAEELEAAALAVPPPAPGTTGMAITYFSPIFDLLGGCAEDFYEQFKTSPIPALQKSATEWVEIIQSRRLTCTTSNDH